MRCTALILILTANVAMASSYTISNFGIDSRVTGLDGTGVEIGQVEPSGRSAKAGFDDPEVSASNTIPTQVYFGTATDGEDGHVVAHATRVAGVMIGNANQGVVFEGRASQL